VFDKPYLDNPTKGFVERLKREGCIFTSTILRDELITQLAALGVSAGTVTIEAKEVPADRSDTDPQTLYVRYPPRYDPNPYIADEVQVEVSVRPLQLPVTYRSLRSILSETFPGAAYPEEPFTVSIVEPRKTFLEKLFLLHEEFGKPDRSRIRHERMSRHPYDLVMTMDTGVGADALADHALYDHLIRHREQYSRISWVDYTSLSHDTLSFLPPSEVLEKYAADYKDMRDHFIYKDAPPFEEIIRRLKWLQGKVRLKKDRRSLEEIVELALETAEELEAEMIRVNVVISAEQPEESPANYQVDFIRQGETLVFEAVKIVPLTEQSHSAGEV
jgi:hypothetical protein